MNMTNMVIIHYQGRNSLRVTQRQTLMELDVDNVTSKGVFVITRSPHPI